jgi:hypothetical protein
MTDTFIQGPYALHEHEASFEIHPLDDEHGETVLADVYYIENGGKHKARAQANLFAASPDMLTALQSALYQLEQFTTSETRENDPDLWAAQIEAIAAIEKATGKAVQS